MKASKVAALETVTQYGLKSSTGRVFVAHKEKAPYDRSNVKREQTKRFFGVKRSDVAHVIEEELLEMVA